MFVVLVIQNRIAIQASRHNLTNLPSERKCSIHHPMQYRAGAPYVYCLGRFQKEWWFCKNLCTVDRVSYQPYFVLAAPLVRGLIN